MLWPRIICIPANATEPGNGENDDDDDGDEYYDDDGEKYIYLASISFTRVWIWVYMTYTTWEIE